MSYHNTQPRCPTTVQVVDSVRGNSKGSFSKSQAWKKIQSQLIEAVSKVDWPEGTGSFTIYPKKKGNGVKPIKKNLILHLESLKWEKEKPLRIADDRKPGKLDIIATTKHGLFAVEWETGNISSSHRAVNKMCVGLLRKALVGGALIVPTRALYKYLTDRVGNWEELEPYFPFWRSLNVAEGVLQIIAVEHDEESKKVPLIPKGTDGRAKR